MVSSEEEAQASRETTMLKPLLGIGSFIQGFRCLPWLAVNFFLKDGLDVDASTLQLLQTSANLPMVAKPLYGVLSDAVYIRGQHRIPYIALGSLLQAVSWLAIAGLSPSGISLFTVTVYLLLSNLGASLAEVANDAIVAETRKHPSSEASSSSGDLQSFVWMASSVGGVAGNLLGGVAIRRFSPQAMFLWFGLLAAAQFPITLAVGEASLDLPRAPSGNGVRRQLRDLSAALRRPEIAAAIAWFAASYAVVPVLTGTMFFYQTRHLGVGPSVVGISKVMGQAGMLAWGVAYRRRLRRVAPRRLICGIQAAMAVAAGWDAVFASGVLRGVGVPDGAYVVLVSGLQEVLFLFKILPFGVLVARLCPPGCEGSLMAFVMSAVALALIVGGCFGVALAACLGVTGDDFGRLPGALLIQAACTLVPLCWSSCIPDDGRKED